MKRLVFKLKKITHKGDSVGRDISVSGTINGNPFSVSERRIQKHASREYDERLTQIDAIVEVVEAPIDFHCAISERDLRWNDIGESDEQINLDLNTTTNNFSINISVAEKWWIFLKRKAVFVLEFEARVFKEETYINETDSHGWLNVRIEGITKPVVLPRYLSVNFVEEKDGRIYFKILEGSYKGKIASIKITAEMDTYFKTGILERFPVDMLYSISAKTFFLNGEKYQATEYEFNKLRIGEFDVLIADIPHEGGVRYFSDSDFATTWFRIMDGDTKYIHTGQVSGGCLTITNMEKWDDIYFLLILARKGDGMHIGTIKVVE